ncbi:MAG: DUF4221 domain-containing protein [Cyclobacteriaceae bacterium]|nr:DUF4221 domain-containing protein [Cyclobacteriaceae bacterium]
MKQLYYLVLFILLSCSSKDWVNHATSHDSKHVQPIDSLTLKSSGELKFKLNNSSNANSNSIQVYPKDQPEFLLYHFPVSNEIALYNLKSREQSHSITYDREGPDGVGDDIRAFYFHSFDSIFLFSLLKQRLFLIDSTGNLINQYDLFNDELYVQMGTTYPSMLKENTLYFSAYPSPLKEVSSNRFTSIKLNLETGEMEAFFHLTSEYDRGDWGKHNYLRIHQTFNTNQDLIIYSFPNDHNLYFLDSEGIIKKHFAGADKINMLKPLKGNRSDDEVFRHTAGQGFYSGIYHDPWRKMYYRIAFNPVSDYEHPSDMGKNPSIILLDQSFRKVGEYALPKNTYLTGAHFISPEGLYFFNRYAYENIDDNYLTFTKYTVNDK